MKAYRANPGQGVEVVPGPVAQATPFGTAEKVDRVQVSSPLKGASSMYANPGASLGEAMRLSPPVASDPTQTYATLRHELGESQELLGSGKIHPFSSHAGPTPILQEQHALLGDPEAQHAFQRLRQSNPADAHVQGLIKRVGGTPNAPLPLGGKQHRALERLIAADASHIGEHARGLTAAFAPRVGYAARALSKIAAHPHDRVQERSNLSPEVVDRAQSLLAKLPDDGQERYHWTLKQDGALKGYLLVKRVGSDNRPVVSTFIGPEMKTNNKGPDLYHRLGDPLVKAAELRTTLLPHQQRVVDRIQKEDQPGLLVVHGLGSGKTLTSIAAQDALKMPATVVVPAALQENYRKEQQKHLKGKPQHTDIETLQRVARRGSPTPNDMLIVDEAHRVRDPSSASHKALGSNEADKRILLTGSPFYNHPSDIAPLINLAAGKEVLPPGKDAFSDRYISIKKESPGLWNKYVRGAQDSETPVLNQSRAKELSATFQKWVDHHPGSKDNFPDVRREDVIVPMGDQQKKVYDTLMGQAPAWVAAKVRQGLPPSKQEAASLTAFLTGPRQVANSSVGFHEKGDPQSPKIQKAFENLQGMLKDNPEGRAVVYSNYLEAGINPYRQLLQGAGVPHGEFTGSQTAKERDQMVRDYNEGKLRALLLSSAGGEGLDLKGTRMVQILEPHWNEEKLKQVEGRAARFKSHEALPEDQRNVIIQRYLAGTPATAGVKIKQKLLGIQPDQTVDQYLTMMSKNKEDLNQQFRGLLPTHKTAAPHHDFLNGVESDARKRGYRMFAVVEDPTANDGASFTLGASKGNAVHNARTAHVRWEKKNGIDPHHDRRSDGEKTAAKLTHFAGLRVRIDRPKGYVQKGKDKEGEPWERVYKVDYGFLPGTQGGDGDGLDVFLGPDEKADPAYLVYQKKDDGSFDEFKLMLGFKDGSSARACYVDHIPSKFLGKMEPLSLNVVRALTGQPLDEEAIVKKAFFQELEKTGKERHSEKKEVEGSWLFRRRYGSAIGAIQMGLRPPYQTSESDD